MPEPVRPWHPAVYDDFAIGSLRALFNGTATEHQQKKAVEYILFELCGIRDLSYRPDSERDTAFAEGKRFVGLQMVKISKLFTKGVNAPPVEAPKRKRTTRSK